ncbi:MAG: SGNH/GDSL hydrolase family protein [Candidatus Paceibacterota bacterium]
MPSLAQINQFLINFEEWLFLLTLREIVIYISYAVIFYFVFHALRMLIILIINKQLAYKSKRWISDNVGSQRNILVLGDSTAVGTGASRAEDSIAGRLAHDFPNVEIVNLGKNGGLFSDVRKQIDLVKKEKFDLIIISVGGNDVWSLTSRSSIGNHLVYILRNAYRMSNGNVFFLLYNNIGDAPIFPKFLRVVLKWRCNRIHSIVKQIAFHMKIPVISLFAEEANNPFTRSPKELFAKDGVHPSSKGYALWYKRMWREMVLRGFHFDR